MMNPYITKRFLGSRYEKQTDNTGYQSINQSLNSVFKCFFSSQGEIIKIYFVD